MSYLELSRWFVIGSLLSMLISIVPLFRNDIKFFKESKNTLPALKYSITWALLIISGFFFTLGSWAFTRAFEEPQPPPLPINKIRHCASDELFAAWCYFIAVLPAIPYSVVFLSTNPYQLTYIGMVVLSVLFVPIAFLFVLTCYPSDHKQTEVCLH